MLIYEYMYWMEPKILLRIQKIIINFLESILKNQAYLSIDILKLV